MTKGIINASTKKKVSPLAVLRATGTIIGVGIAAGIALIAVTDTVFKKVTGKEETSEEAEAPVEVEEE